MHAGTFVNTGITVTSGFGYIANLTIFRLSEGSSAERRKFLFCEMV